MARLAERFSNATVVVFGVVMTGFAALVTFETLARKFMNISLQGVDELGGYVLAVTSSLAFTLALLDRAHIRIDLFHLKLPLGLRAALNWTSAAMTTAFAALLVYVGVIVLRETIDFGSTAPTPWATPLYGRKVYGSRGSSSSSSRRLRISSLRPGFWRPAAFGELDRRHGPKGAEEEVQEELADLERR